MPVILVTFAGRKTRMQILNQYIRKAMDAGIIDEWHVWDFTRSEEDKDWVAIEFGPARYMGADVPYQLRGKLTSRSSLRMKANITNDLHIAIMPNSDPENGFEIVVGGWNNTHSAIRRIKPEQLANLARPDDATIWTKPTPGVLSPSIPNDIILSMDSDGIPTLRVNDATVGTWPEMNLASGATVMVRGGWGSDLELCEVDAPVRRYIGNPFEQIPYWQAYAYYSKRLQSFSDSLFLKCDDDIVYLDIEKLDAFIQFRKANPNYFVISANVVNNGVCAYFQQQAGSIPEAVGAFERPPGGFGGTLWQSPQMATKLHQYFLNKEDKHMPLAEKVIDWDERQSINFIAWLGKDLLHMALPKCDDEYALTVDLPTFLNRPTAIFSDFVVSHLSFGPQERGLDVEPLIAAYEELMNRQLSS
jgi:hypothetical protein